MASILNVDKLQSTATDGNIVVDPNGTGLFLPNRTPCFFARLSSDQTVNDATETVVQFATQDFDIGGIWDTSNYRLTVDASTLGYYHLSGFLYTDGSNGIEDQRLRIRKNGSTYVETYGAAEIVGGSASGTNAGMFFTVVIPLTTSGDYADVALYADRSSSGTTRINELSSGGSRTYVSGFRVGGA